MKLERVLLHITPIADAFVLRFQSEAHGEFMSLLEFQSPY